jgi:hypothetical protein
VVVRVRCQIGPGLARDVDGEIPQLDMQRRNTLVGRDSRDSPIGSVG